MILEAFAKINWSLDITGVRDDGYHFMDMLMQPVSIADEIHLSPSRFLSLSTGGYPPVRADENNLAYRAALLLKNETSYPGGASIHVEKRIPVGAGMGGGSADAAAVLTGLNRMWKTGLSEADLERIGLRLGADVPFCIRGGLARTGGIGEKLENHSFASSYMLVVIQPCPGLSTKQVFSLWRNSDDLVRPDTAKVLSALESGNRELLCRSISNVLQPVSEQLRPEIGTACSLLLSSGALAAEMTGSGSAVFGVFPSSAAAQKAAGNLSGRYRAVFVCHTQQDSIRLIQE